MRIYTKTGDQGETSLFGGARVAKDDLRVEVCGSVDELNAELGAARSALADPADSDDQLSQIDQLLARIQSELFDLGAELATREPDAKGTDLLSTQHIDNLEQAIDQQEAHLEPLRAFILPGGSQLASRLHVARCVCRRAERRLVTLAREAEIRTEPLVYLNRLSDLLFVLARRANVLAGISDVVWQANSDR